MAQLRVTLYVGSGRHKIGPGKIRLLEQIRDQGSISRAARAMKMAYRHAWEMVDDLNACFDEPVLTTSAGGRAGGGAALTEWGHELISRFHALEAAAMEATRSELRSLARREKKTGH